MNRRQKIRRKMRKAERKRLRDLAATATWGGNILAVANCKFLLPALTRKQWHSLSRTDRKQLKKTLSELS